MDDAVEDSGPEHKWADSCAETSEQHKNPITPVAAALLAHPQRIGRYRVEKVLGRGGFGLVYLAYDGQLERLVAIKVPRPRLVEKARDAEAYLTEARTVANLDHPHIVPVFDVGSTEQFPCFIVSKYIDGGDLAVKVKESRLAVHDAVELVATVAEALHYAHSKGLVHRDIKPSNILLDKNGKPFVVDFGLTLREWDVGNASRFVMTPAYMSPEQARGEGHRVDCRSDIFSLGVVLYELLAGRRPFKADSLDELCDQITNVDARPPRQIDDRIPKELDRICLKALSRRAPERYSVAKDMADDLRYFLISASADKERTLTAGASSEMDAATAIPTPTRIVPKGLRSFDAHDADFFLELLPGPRDRDGLPDGVRFWKTRVEDAHAHKKFSVGLIYGPSGCGKSSLVKAGLLPRLAKTVTAVYVEATDDETESRLLKSLRRQVPDLPGALDLGESLMAVRQGRFLESAQKVLLVLDQFEQWLNGRHHDEKLELVQALRQCDGERLQCILMVRDDFGMAATRFMRQLEIPLVEGDNFATVDLFDPLHAREVLAAFGHAYGRLPANPSQCSNEQESFLDQVVAGLAQEGRIIPIRLALFAEMVKSKPWTPATLKEVGGAEGVGVTFLEETFTAPNAPPQYRLHRKAAQAVLKALLPEAGMDIRGHLVSQQELLEASAYASHPQDFGDLLRILDGELRLVTPTDVEAPEPNRAMPPGVEPATYYQLTHDYLVPSLRDWLTRKQRETRRGRAELRLAERAAAYGVRHDARQLPGWREWANILFFTRRRHWTSPEREVMRAAGKRRQLQAMFLAIILLTGALTSHELRHRIDEERDRLQADGLVQRLLTVPLGAVPLVRAELKPYHHLVGERLREVIEEKTKFGDAQRLRASIGLLESDPAQAGPITVAMLNANPDEARVLIAVLKPPTSELTERLRRLLTDAESAPPSRLRAAMALADYSPPGAEERSWLAVAPLVVDQMLIEARQDPSQYEPLVAALAPAADVLLPSLVAVFRDPGRNSTERDLATSVLAKYAASDVKTLVDLISDAQPDQFLTLFPAVEKHRGTAIDHLAIELGKQATPDWHDRPLDPSWRKPAESLLAHIRAADGILAERFALVQTLPIDQLSELTEGLRDSGYRPIRCRPFSTGHQRASSGPSDTLVAAVWCRDAIDWKAGLDLTAEELRARNAELSQGGYLPIDVAGYVKDDATRFMALWARGDDGEERRLCVDVSDLGSGEGGEIARDHFRIATLHSYASPDGFTRYAAVWRRSAGEIDWQWDTKMTPDSYQASTMSDRLEIDVSLSAGAVTPTTRTEAQAALDMAATEPTSDDPQTPALARPERRYAAVFEIDVRCTSVSLDGPSPQEHLARCREKAALGYRPTAIALADASGVSDFTAVSVWCLPRVEGAAAERLAMRQANAAAALMRLGKADYVWPLFEHRSDPQRRSWLVHHVARLGVEPKLLTERLFATRDLSRPPDSASTDDVLFHGETSLHRALLLALGEFNEKQLPPAQRATLLDKVVELHRSDPDAGIHAAAEWLIERWGGASQVAEGRKLRNEEVTADGRQWFVNSQGQTMVVVRGPLEFLMGSPAEEPGRETFETLHRRRIDRSFAIAAHEVTVDQVKRWNPSFYYMPRYASAADGPMNNVSWYDAAEYCNWLSDQEGLERCYELNPQGRYDEGMRPAADYLLRDGYRLPTVAEWEFACRAGTRTSRYYGASEALLGQYAWYAENSHLHLSPVGSLKPNDLGLFDALGNAVEWCGDVQSAYTHCRLDLPAEDAGDVSVLSDKVQRSVRGGGFLYHAYYVRNAVRMGFNPTYRDINYGLRVARTLPDR